jgi:hypothetical protein
MSMLPASPKNIRAGGKLKGRKPRRLPTKTAATTATAGWDIKTAIIEIVAQRIMPMVVANPSIPSSKFKELIAPRSQNTVKGIEKYPSDIL